MKKAIILAGGSGTRLRPYTFSIPKPLIPIKEKPILELIIRRLAKFGISEIILAVGYGSELIKTYFGNGKKFKVKINYVEEKKRLGTAGPIKLVRGIKKPFLVMNGDILTKLDFNKIFQYHKINKAEITVATRKYTHCLPFGVVELKDKEIIGIKEKPEYEVTISTGIYVMSPAVLKYIPENTYFDIPDLIKKLIANNKKVVSYKFNEYWLAIEKPEHFEEANNTIKEWID